MKKLFFTVGTTDFPALTRKANELHKSKKFKVVAQSPTRLKDTSLEQFNFKKNLIDYFLSSDLVITHAGAGSCYKLIELGVPIIIVPNLNRRDKHQKEIALYFEKNNYCSVCWDLNNLENIIEKQDSVTFTPYKKTPFFLANLIFSQ